MIRLTLLTLLINVLILSSGAGQSPTEEINFSKYLINKKYYDEAVWVLRQQHPESLTKAQGDSIHFLLGSVYHQQQELESAIEAFDAVSPLLPRLRSESLFYSSLDEAYLHRPDNAWHKLNSFQTVDSLLLDLRNLEMAGTQLLLRNFRAFDSMHAVSNTSSYLVTRHWKEFEDFKRIVRSANRKSPAKAGLLSALVPGAGKYYAGQKGQAIFNFIVAGLLGLQAYEGYDKAGPNSFRFIAYASLFTAFYISNIWGSTLSVKIKRREINNTIDDQILLGMHIPIRTAFR